MKKRLRFKIGKLYRVTYIDSALVDCSIVDSEHPIDVDSDNIKPPVDTIVGRLSRNLPDRIYLEALFNIPDGQDNHEMEVLKSSILKVDDLDGRG